MSEPLHMTIAGHPVVVTRRATDVAIQIYLGFLGWQAITIPLEEWRQIEAHVNRE